jgi:hypothetical protein
MQVVSLMVKSMGPPPASGHQPHLGALRYYRRCISSSDELSFNRVKAIHVYEIGPTRSVKCLNILPIGDEVEAEAVASNRYRFTLEVVETVHTRVFAYREETEGEVVEVRL